MDNIQLFCKDRLDFLNDLSEKAQLIVTSPPYNLGKEYEQKSDLEYYIEHQRATIKLCAEKLKDTGSICWQIGHFINGSGKRKDVFPLDLILYPIFVEQGFRLKNRIIWHFGHGLHDTYRFSGRHETILWFVKSDDYTFNLDPIRVPQKYPNKKAFRGERKGQLSCNPLGKNPSDVWEISNVKHNHPEKVNHPCQFPEALVERLVLSLTNEMDLIVDPYIGSGTTAVVAQRLNRRCMGADIKSEYIKEAQNRLLITT
jgi:adenine-specific DNA-methyltransferase